MESSALLVQFTTLRCTFSNNRGKCNRVRPNQYACSNGIAGTLMCARFVLCLCTPPFMLKKGFFARRAMKVVAFGVEAAKQWHVYWARWGCRF